MHKTIIRFGFCDIQNNQGQGLSKGSQPQPSIAPTSILIIKRKNYSSKSYNSVKLNKQLKIDEILKSFVNHSWGLSIKIKILNSVTVKNIFQKRFPVFALQLVSKYLTDSPSMENRVLDIYLEAKPGAISPCFSLEKDLLP